MRREGLVPAVVYGKSQESQNIKVNAKEFTTLLKASASEHILVDLDLEGSKKLAILQDVQHDPLTGTYVHADFHVVSATETVHAAVVVETTGEARGIKSGGILEVLVHELDVACLAENLPENITIDVSNLDLGDAIHVADLVLPKGVKVEMEPSLVVLHVSEPKVAVETEATAAAEPEVLREKKPAESK